MKKSIFQTLPPKPIQAAVLTVYADLLQQLEAGTEIVGSVRTQKIKGKEYLKANATIGTVRKTIYLGPAMDPEAKQRAEAIQQEMARAKARRQLVSLLRRSGLPGPRADFGRVLEVVASVGLFRNGVTLIGTAAYQNYPALVGAILPAGSLMTQDMISESPLLRSRRSKRRLAPAWRKSSAALILLSGACPLYRTLPRPRPTFETKPDFSFKSLPRFGRATTRIRCPSPCSAREQLRCSICDGWFKTPSLRRRSTELEFSFEFPNQPAMRCIS